jgi:hypothetical protein
MCIRAIDYCPPVDVTYGDYMRALITADFDLVPEDDRNYRVAIIEAFRAWGIYPEDIRTLSVESLRWRVPPPNKAVQAFVEILRPTFLYDNLSQLWKEIASGRPNTHHADFTFRKYTRMELARKLSEFSAMFHDEVERSAAKLVNSGKLKLEDRPFGLNIGYGHQDDCKFEVHQVRPVRRQAPDGRTIQDLLIQITQRRPGYLDEEQQRRENERYMVKGNQPRGPKRGDLWYRGGVTLILDLESFEVRYAMYKDVVDTKRLDHQRDYTVRASGLSLREVYFGTADTGQRLAAMHSTND